MEDESLFDRVMNAFKHKLNETPDKTDDASADKASADKPNAAAPAKAEAVPAVQGTPLPATKSEGELMLIKTDERTAAVIMAIISDRSKIPLNRLSFKSIKLLDTV